MATCQKPTTDRTRFSYIEEIECGVTPPTPVMQLIGFTGESYTENRGFTASTEINEDRNIKDTVNTSVAPSGGHDAEYRINENAPLVAAVLQDDATAPIDITELMTIDATTPAAVILTCGTAVFDSFVVGDFAKLSGYTEAGNNGVVKVITTTSALSIVVEPVSGQTMVDVTDDTGRIYSAQVSNGTTTKSFTFQKSFDGMEVPAFFKYRGVQFSNLTYNFATGSILTANYVSLGLDLDPLFTESAGTTYLQSSQEPILDCVDSVGRITVDGDDADTVATAITIAINNNSRGQDAIGTAGHVGIGHGLCDVTGTITAYFENIAQYERFKQQESFAVDLFLVDNDGTEMIITLPRIKITAFPIMATGANADLLPALTFQALKDLNSFTTIKVTYLTPPTP